MICLDERGPERSRLSYARAGTRRAIASKHRWSTEWQRRYGSTGLTRRRRQTLTLSGRTQQQRLPQIARGGRGGKSHRRDLLQHRQPRQPQEGQIREWLGSHPRVEQVFIPKGADWLNLQEAWWRMFRREALAGQHFADAEEIELATSVATKQLNQRSKPWVWGRPPKPPGIEGTLMCTGLRNVAYGSLL